MPRRRLGNETKAQTARDACRRDLRLPVGKLAPLDRLKLDLCAKRRLRQPGMGVISQKALDRAQYEAERDCEKLDKTFSPGPAHMMIRRAAVRACKLGAANALKWIETIEAGAM
jgi:hypothetical protein